MIYLRASLLMLLMLAATIGAADEPAAPLPAALQLILDGHGLDPDGLSVIVRGVDGSEPLLDLNADMARSPASIIKLLTTFAALDILGPAYTWRTEAYLSGPLQDGRLEGDLILKGGGDPYLTTERFWTFLRTLRARGLRQIDGDLVIDNGFFDPSEEDPGAFDGQPFRTYNVTPDALLVNLKAVQFRVYRPVPGAKPNVVTDPVISNLEIDNRIGNVQGPCGGFQRGVAIDLLEGLEGNRVQLSGRFPTGCNEYSLYRTVMTPPEFTYGVFEPLWTQLGGGLAGHVETGTAPEDESPFAWADSVPLAEIVRNINKFSNNVMTRQVLLTIGAEMLEPPGTVEKGRQAISDWLGETGLSMPSLYVDNGSGLSRNTRVSAAGLADMMLAAWRHPYMSEFMSSMPLAGLDGTLRNRYRGGSLAGRVHAKTGRLDDVYSIAGYVQSRSGRRFVVVAIHNDDDVHRGPGQELQNALLRWVNQQ